MIKNQKGLEYRYPRIYKRQLAIPLNFVQKSLEGDMFVQIPLTVFLDQFRAVNFKVLLHVVDGFRKILHAIGNSAFAFVM
jgi:hypothetical protein